MDSAFQYGVDVGHDLEGDYPYTMKRGTCTQSTKTVATQLTSFVDVTKDSVDELLAAAAEGPVSVAIQANKAVF